MFIKQLYTEYLGKAAYYIESNREAAVVDPLRETESYLRLAEERDTTIKYIFETHFHADFVSGHVDLARETGAAIIYGPYAKPEYSAYVAMDKEIFNLGDIRIKVLHTPGHTMESTCYLLIDEDGQDYCVFTGDTLFNGGVGRPELISNTGVSREEMLNSLYDSLKTLRFLDDHMIVYPAHGGKHQYGKNMKSETFTTIGDQKRSNDAFQPVNSEEFMELVTEGLEEPPACFMEIARINRVGYDTIDEVLQRNMQPLSVEDFEKEVDKGAAILDTRSSELFAKGFIPSSLNIGLNRQNAVCLGSLLNINQPLVLITENEKEKESILRLASVGFENVKGFLKGGMESWQKAEKPLETV